MMKGLQRDRGSGFGGPIRQQWAARRNAEERRRQIRDADIVAIHGYIHWWSHLLWIAQGCGWIWPTARPHPDARPNTTASIHWLRGRKGE